MNSISSLTSKIIDLIPGQDQGEFQTELAGYLKSVRKFLDQILEPETFQSPEHYLFSLKNHRRENLEGFLPPGQQHDLKELLDRFPTSLHTGLGTKILLEKEDFVYESSVDHSLGTYHTPTRFNILPPLNTQGEDGVGHSQLFQSLLSMSLKESGLPTLPHKYRSALGKSFPQLRLLLIHLTEWFQTPEKEFADFVSSFPSLQEVSILVPKDTRDISSYLMELGKYNPHLTGLDLTHTQVFDSLSQETTQSIFSSFPNLRSLRFLDDMESTFSPSTIHKLSPGLSGLRELRGSFHGFHQIDTDLQSELFSSLRQLRALSLIGNKSSHRNQLMIANTFSHLTQLRYLSLCDIPIERVPKGVITKLFSFLPHLKHLDLPLCILPDNPQIVENLSQHLSGIQSLSLHGSNLNNCSSEVIEALFAPLGNLRHLDLGMGIGNSARTTSHLASIAKHCPHIQSLNRSEHRTLIRNWKKSDVEVLGLFPELRHLVLRNILIHQMNDEALESFAQLALQLETLDLRDAGFPADDAYALKKLFTSLAGVREIIISAKIAPTVLHLFPNLYKQIIIHY